MIVAQGDVVVACGKLVRYSRHLASHVEPLLVELGPPWALTASSAQPQVATLEHQPKGVSS